MWKIKPKLNEKQGLSTSPLHTRNQISSQEKLKNPHQKAKNITGSLKNAATALDSRRQPETAYKIHNLIKKMLQSKGQQT